MARVAVALDAPMRRLGLSGRSFVPLMTGCGCTVPAVLAVRTLPNERDRRFTALLAPYIPCGAKAPVYLFCRAVSAQYGLLPVLALYLLGLAAARCLPPGRFDSCCPGSRALLWSCPATACPACGDFRA